MKIVLAGNPNSGKTTLYNVLTGKNERAGNWAGVTVSKKESPLKSNFNQNSSENIVIVDLPGAYSMSPFTSEESITSAYVKNEKADVVVNIVDATNLSRSLFFTSQLLELGIPVVIALNKIDINKKSNIRINIGMLSQKINCPIVEISAISSDVSGIERLVKNAISIKGNSQKAPFMQGQIDINNKQEVENADKRRFDFVNNIVKEVEDRQILSSEHNTQDKIDSVVAHKVLGIPIFAVVMFLVFYISQSLLGPIIADALVGIIEGFGEIVGEQIEDASPFLQALLVDGIIGGVGAVIGFLPLVMVMYFLIALLEDCGYMARVAVVMDTFFKKVGLSGKSIIPMIIGTGCAIPGIMASRTIKNERERRTTAMLTPFMPCGAKLPVIALFAGAFFEDASWVGTLMYFLGIAIIIVCAMLILKITGHKVRKSFFIIELPQYKVPSLKFAFDSMMSRAKAFIIKAGTIILLCNALVQIMQSFDWTFNFVEEGLESTSILAGIASPFALLFIPLGFGAWQLAAATVTGFIAKENVVGTLAVVYGITNFIDTEELELISGATEVAGIMGLTSVGALSYLIFNLFTPPCFAAIGAMNSEMQSKKWLLGGIGLQFGVAYVLSYFTYQIGTFITTGGLGEGFLVGLVVVVLIFGILIGLIKSSGKNLEEYRLNAN